MMHVELALHSQPLKEASQHRDIVKHSRVEVCPLTHRQMVILPLGETGHGTGEMRKESVHLGDFEHSP